MKSLLGKSVAVLLGSMFFALYLMMTTASAQEINKVTLITQVLPEGEKAVALAVKYDSNIDSTTLSIDSFAVEANVGGKIAGRNIIKVYTNDAPAIAAQSKVGKYVILEMNPEDANAGTSDFNPATWLSSRLTLNYYVTQMHDIADRKGNTIAVSMKKIKNSAQITPIVDSFTKKTFTDSTGSLNYRLFKPDTKMGKEYPLVIFLHGMGERGFDNSLQLTGYRGALVWATPENQAKNPAFVVAPQCPPNTYWPADDVQQLVLKTIKDVIAKYPIDTNRIYINGLSMGGFGSWKLIQNNPNLFAAAVIVCGAGDPNNVEPIKNMPIWLFHAADDPIVKVSGVINDPRMQITAYGSRDMAAALRAAGNTVIRYTEYEKGYVAPPLAPMGHFSWIPAYNNPEIIDWMFSQTKAGR